MYSTASAIYGIKLQPVSKPQLMRLTFKLSVRGSIRQAPSVITWITTLSNMKQWGPMDPQTAIKDWNAEAPPSGKLVGAKATAVQLLLDKMPEATLKMIIDHVSVHTWSASLFSDECLASKKISWLCLFRLCNV